MKKMSSDNESVNVHRQTGDKPAGPVGVGNEKKADVRGTQEGGSRAEARCGPGDTKMSSAVHELHKQHPHGHEKSMTNKETRDHIRHMPGRY
jgi:hypothetical protein